MLYRYYDTHNTNFKTKGEISVGKLINLGDSKREDVIVGCYEVLTLFSGDDGIEIWPDDSLRIILQDNREYSPYRCK